jgi:hypothetical protein
MPASKLNAKAVLTIVDSRMYETLQAFEVLCLLNERLESKALNDSVNASLGFWQPVTVGLQTTLILGVFALLDKKNSESATVYALRDELRAVGNSAADADFWSDVDAIRKRYERARHKIFGHNDLCRDDEVFNFASMGLTWRIVQDDLATLRRTVKALYALFAGKALPTRADLDASLHEPDLGVIRTRRDTAAVLDRLSYIVPSET